MRKKIAAVAAVMATVLIAAVAYAYWTAGGTGSGDATAGTDSGVSITSVAFADDDDADTSSSLYPGSSVDVTFTVENNSTDTPVKVGDVDADGSTHPGGIQIDSDHAGCDASWFTYSGTTLDEEIAASDSFDATAGNGGTLSMSNESVSQDACKGATITLHLVVDNAAIA